MSLALWINITTFLVYFVTLCYIAGSAFINILNLIKFDTPLGSSKGSHKRTSKTVKQVEERILFRSIYNVKVVVLLI